MECEQSVNGTTKGSNRRERRRPEQRRFWILDWRTRAERRVKPRKLSECKVENAKCRMDGTTDEHESTRMGFEQKATKETERR